MTEAPAAVRHAVEAVMDGGSVADPEIALLIVEAVTAAHPEVFRPKRPSASPTEPMILAAIDPDGSRWVAVSVKVNDTQTSQVLVAWSVDAADLDVDPDDPVWFEADRSAIEPYLGVTILDDAGDYPNWVEPCIGEYLTCGRKWGDRCDVDTGIGPVDAVLDDLFCPPGPDADADAHKIVRDAVHDLVATAVEANHPGEIDPAAGIVGVTAGVRRDREGPYLAAALLVLDSRGRCAQAHLTVDLRPWDDHPLVAYGMHLTHDRTLIGGRVGVVSCLPEEFPTWPQPAMDPAA
jgi:hypothetical protein